MAVYLIVVFVYVACFDLCLGCMHRCVICVYCVGVIVCYVV